MRDRLKLPPDYPYAYETHLHTSEGSKCAANDGREMAYSCKEAGYTGIIVTNHFIGGNTAVDVSLPWRDWVEEFCLGYENAKEEGDRIGLQVFFGWEAGFNGTESLVYGLDKEWLIAHPEIRNCTIAEQYRMVHEGGGMVIHPHPFREEWYIPEIVLYPEYCDGVETVNATHESIRSKAHNNPEFDVRALEYAKKHNMPQTAGSDIHSVNLLYGGMAFGRRLTDIKDYIKAVQGREKCILLTGNESVD
ncbi:MAG: histidinol-phosphatase [Lachnospiraceae bacterium]|nr:histidinol-phosphatase [Candidatus Merdinaster equi]